MKATDKIFTRYYEALIADWDDEHAIVGAARMALRLAIGDAYAAGGALADDLAAIVASQAQAKPEQRAAESAINQIGRLNEWLEVNAPALYHNPDLDTAAAVLAELGVRDRRMIEQSAAIADLRFSLKDVNEDAASARQELTKLIAERDGLRQQIAHMDVDNAELVRQLRQARNEADARWFSGDQELSVQLRLAQAEIDRLTRENTIAVDTLNSHLAWQVLDAAAVGHVSNVTEPPVDWWTSLDEETNDWRISVEAARRTFRQVPKPARLRMAVAVALHIGNGQMPKQADFDARRPAWMSSATAFCSTFGCTWYELPKVLA